MKNEKIVQSVIYMLASDGKIEPREEQFLRDLCQHLRVSYERVSTFARQAEQNKQHIYVPETPAEQTKLFTLLMQAAASDGTIAPQEQRILQTIASKIGMNPRDLRHIIDMYLSNPFSSKEIASSIPEDTSEHLQNQAQQVNATEILSSPNKQKKKKPRLFSSINILRMSLAKKIAIGVLIVMIFSGVGGFYLYRSHYLLPVLDRLVPGGATILTVSAPVPNPKPIDKLFTAFVYMPILDRKYKDGIKLTGYCFRQYEVGIGYDNVLELFPKYLNMACQDKAENMPLPQVLSTNTVDADAKGDYTTLDCDSLDKGTRQSHRMIKGELMRTKHWEIITQNSRNMLMSYMKVYCPVE